MDRFIIKAKPQPYDVIPYKTLVRSDFSDLSSLNPYITVIGRSFINVRNVYLSGSNDFMLYNTTYYNPFSASYKLSADNPGFYGLKIEKYIIQQEKYLTFDTSNLFNNSGHLDVIIENEAGYGLLSKDSFIPSLSTNYGLINYQKPCISGINLIYDENLYPSSVETEYDSQFLSESNLPFIAG